MVGYFASYRPLAALGQTSRKSSCGGRGSNIRAIKEYLEEQGAEIREAVVIPDRVRLYVLDPFGNYFEFIEMKSV
jgi:hypothetical protein